MTTFTGYEPNNVPISLGPAGTLSTQAGSASDPAAGQTIVQAEAPDTLASDLGSMIDQSMISVEDFLEAPMVSVNSSGKPRAEVDTQIVPSIARGNPEQEHVQLRQELNALRFQLKRNEGTS